MSVWVLSLIGSTLGFTFGSALLKRFADTNELQMLLFSFGVLGVSNLLFVHVIRGGLGQGVIASSLSQIVFMAGLGALYFGERLTIQQILGVLLAALSLWLIMSSGSSAYES